MSSTPVDIDPPELVYVTTPNGPIWVNRMSVAAIGPAYGSATASRRRLYTWGSDIEINDTPENLITLGVSR